jgi:hypothetical protein
MSRYRSILKYLLYYKAWALDETRKARRRVLCAAAQFELGS